MRLDWFGNITYKAFKDDSGVYFEGKKIALSNTASGGYVRYDDGMIDFEAISECSGIYTVSTPLVFVGALVDCGCTEQSVLCQIFEGQGCDDSVTGWTFDKKRIAESEGIPLEELKKFDGVMMVRVNYTTIEPKEYNPACDYSLC